MPLSCHVWRLLALYAVQAACHPNSCAKGCQLALSHIEFVDVAPDLGYYPTQCGSQLRQTSLYSCMRVYCTQQGINSGLPQLKKECELYGHITLPPFDIIDNFTDEDISHFRQIMQDEFVGLKLDEPAIPSRPLYTAAFKTQEAWNDSVKLRYDYGNAMFYFWAIVVTIGLGNRLLHSRTLMPLAKGREKGECPTLSTGPSFRRLIKRHVALPALFSHHCSEPIGWCMIPPRTQSSILVMFMIINFVLCSVSYDVFADNLYWPPATQWCRYIADRTGVIATANLPLIWIFATRNNLVLYLTGWSFDTTMQFHRWVARISTIQAVIHSIAYTIEVVVGGSWEHFWELWTARYWVMGTLATITMCLICAFSVYPMRKHLYETFLLFHIALAVLTLVGMWYHVEIFLGEYNWYIWPCIIIWLLDRFARICRLFWLNFPFHLSSAYYDTESDVVWLSVPSAVTRKPRPGEYYFLYVLQGLTFYENHPFTLSSWECSTKHSLRNVDKPNLLFLVRPYDGFTSRLRDLAKSALSTSRNSSTSRRIRVLIEGPYGLQHNLRSFESLVFVVGGTGIAVAMAYLTDLEGRVRDREQAQYQTKHFRIVWAVRDRSFFLDLYEREIKPRLSSIAEFMRMGVDIRFSLDIYITRSIPRTSLNALENGHLLDDRTVHSVRQSSEEQNEEEDENQPLMPQDAPCARSTNKLDTDKPPGHPPPVDQIKNKTQDHSTEHSPLLSPSFTLPPSRSASPSHTPSTSISLQLPSSLLPSVGQFLHRPPETASEPILPSNTIINIRYNRPSVQSIIHTACCYDHSSDISPCYLRDPPSSSAALDIPNQNQNTIAHTNRHSGQDRGTLAVISCGPPGLADATRAAVVKLLGDEKCRDMEFYSESYSW